MRKHIHKTVVAVLVLTIAQFAWADLSAGLVAYYDFDGSAADASGNGHDGAVHGAMLTADRFGNSASAYSFDGDDDYIGVPFADVPSSSAMTLAAWICPSNDLSLGGSGTAIVARGEDFETDRLWSSLLVFAEDNPWGTGTAMFYEDAGDTERIYDTGVFPSVGAWTHLAATRSTDGSLAVFINGILSREWTETPAPATVTQELTIGARYYSSSSSGPYDLANFFSGTIDEVRLYDRALTENEIRDLSVVPLPGATLLGILGLSVAGYRLRKERA